MMTAGHYRLDRLACPGGDAKPALARHCVFHYCDCRVCAGARGVAGMSAGIGRTLLFVFLVLAIIFVIVSFVRTA